MQTAGSRGPLCCSRNQLTHILTYYQVMPSFLDFCFEFRKRDLVTTNMFRVEDFLLAKDIQSTPSISGQRETRIQHAFNIMAFEEETMKDPQDKEDLQANWLLRHTTVYHSFDTQQARSLWVVIKGNKTIRDRLTLSPESQRTEDIEHEKLVGDQFKATLFSHLHILEWGTENWGQYIDDLAERSRKPISTVKHAPVEILASNLTGMDLPKQTPTTRRSHQRAGTGLSRAPTVALATVRRAFSAVSGISTTRQGADPQDVSTVLNNQVQGGNGEKDARLDDIFTFDDLQEAHRLADMVQTANLVMDQNLRVLAQLRNRYTSLARRKELGLVADDILDFVQQISMLEGDLEGHQSRIRALGHSLEMNEEMVGA